MKQRPKQVKVIDKDLIFGKSEIDRDMVKTAATSQLKCETIGKSKYRLIF